MESMNTTKVNLYSISSQIGDGRYSVVRQGFRDNDKENKKYAIKILNNALIHQTNPHFIERELYAYKNLNNFEGIPKFYDYFCDGDSSYFVLEYIDGYHLQREMVEREILKNGPPFTTEEKKDILLKAIQIIRRLHKKHFYHGDLKLENVLYISNIGEVRLVDFGCSIYSEKPYTTNKELIGTPGFSPPEILQSSGDPLILEHLDTWGLCNIFYYLFTKRYAFGNVGVGETLRKTRACDFYQENIDPKIIRICERVFNKIPGDRASLDEFEVMIRDFEI